MGDDSHLSDDPCELPSTVEEIHVSAVSTPHSIVAYSVKDRSTTLTNISNKLSKLAKKYSTNLLDIPKTGTLTIVQGQVGASVELPAWWCRGIVEGRNDSTSEYNIYLPDHGVSLSLPRHQFFTVPKDSISDDYLTYSIGLHHIAPGVLTPFALDKKKQYEMVIQKQWSPDAIKVTKCLIGGAAKVYFDHISNSDGQKYGEIYTIIDREVVSLRKALIHSNLGTYLREEHYEIIRHLESEPDAEERILLEPPLLEPDDSPETTSEASLTKTSRDKPPYPQSDLKYEEVFISDSSKCDRLTSTSDANFRRSIHTALNDMDMVNLWKIPSYTWPAISKCCDVLTVSAKGTGKTIGYAAPISHLILTTQQEQEDNYPMALILCSSTNAAQSAHDMFARVLAQNAEISIVSGYNGVPYRSLTAQIYNGCHIFISTPAFLQRYLSKEEHRRVLNLDYIRHIVFDQMDVMLEKQKSVLVQVLKETPIGRRKCDNLKGFTVQMIAVAEQWSTTIQQFTEMFSDPYICIGSHPDAVIACGIQPKLRQIPAGEKAQRLLELLDDRYRSVKTLVVCRSRREASRVKKQLAGHCGVIYVDGRSSIDEIYEARVSWSLAIAGMYPVLVCSDSVLREMKISDVEWLIHYSIGTQNKSIFNFRFSALISNLKSRSAAMDVTIMLDESNDLQLRGILDLMERSGVKLTQKQLQVADRIMMTVDRRKEEFSICDKVKAFGHCSRKFNCPYRHWVLPDVDRSRLPVEQGETVKLLLTYIHTATQFSGRILESVDFKGDVHKITDDEHVDVVSRVNHYFADHRNKAMERNIAVGRICGYRREESHFERVLVINIVKRDEEGRARCVDIKCIDTGLGYHSIRTCKLLKLSDALREAPAYIVDIFLSNIMPYDNEDEWSLCAMNCVQKWLKDHRSSSTFFEARVQLVLGNTIWIDPLEIKMKVTGKRDQQISTLKSHLIKMNHGISDNNHIERLHKLCQIGNAPHL